MSQTQNPLQPPKPPETAAEKEAREKEEERKRQELANDFRMRQSREFATFRIDGWKASGKTPDQDQNDNQPGFLGAFEGPGAPPFFARNTIYDHPKITKGFGILHDKNGNVSSIPPIGDWSDGSWFRHALNALSHDEEKERIGAEADFLTALGYDAITVKLPAMTAENKNTLMNQFEFRLKAIEDRKVVTFHMDRTGPFMQSLTPENRQKLEARIEEVNRKALINRAANPEIYNAGQAAVRDLNAVRIPDVSNPQLYKDAVYKAKAKDDLASANGDGAKLDLAEKKLKVAEKECAELEKSLSGVTDKNSRVDVELKTKYEMIAKHPDSIAKIEKVNVEIESKRKSTLNQIDSKLTDMDAMQKVWKAELKALETALAPIKTKLTTERDAEQDPGKKQELTDKVNKIEAQIKKLKGLDAKVDEVKVKLDEEKTKVKESKKASVEFPAAVQDAREKHEEKRKLRQ